MKAVYDSPDGTLEGTPKLYGPTAVAAGAKRYNTAGMVHVCMSTLPIGIKDSVANLSSTKPTLIPQRRWQF